MNKIPHAKLVWAMYQLLNETFIRHIIVWDYVQKEVKYLAHNKDTGMCCIYLRSSACL